MCPHQTNIKFKKFEKFEISAHYPSRSVHPSQFEKFEARTFEKFETFEIAHHQKPTIFNKFEKFEISAH